MGGVAVFRHIRILLVGNGLLPGVVGFGNVLNVLLGKLNILLLERLTPFSQIHKENFIFTVPVMP